MTLTRLSAPASLPIVLDDVKEFCRVEDTDNDTLLTAFMSSAVELAENETGQRFISQQWRLDLGGFDSEIVLPYPKFASVDSIQYYDTANALQTLSSDYYDADGVGAVGCITLAYGYTYPSVYPRPDAVQITFTCGDVIANVPQSAKDAMHTMCWFLFDGRGDQLDRPFLNYLLSPHVMRGFYES